jgi:hypothetical protein
MSCAKGLVGGRGSSWSLSYFCSTRRFFLIFAFLRRPCVSGARRIRRRMGRLRRSLRGALETYFELFKNITGASLTALASSTPPPTPLPPPDLEHFEPPPPPEGEQRSTKCHEIDRGCQGDAHTHPWPATPPIYHDLVEATSTYHPAKNPSQIAPTHTYGIVGPAPSGVKTQPEGPGRCTVGQGVPWGQPQAILALIPLEHPSLVHVGNCQSSTFWG